MRMKRDRFTQTTRTGMDTPLTAAIHRFGSESQQEREAIQWIESLSPAESKQIVANAITEWKSIAN